MDKILNFLFTTLFGKIDIEAEIYVNAERILIINLVVNTARFGKFAFPVFHKRLPEAGTGYVLESTTADSSLEAGEMIDNDPFEDFLQSRPA